MAYKMHFFQEMSQKISVYLIRYGVSIGLLPKKVLVLQYLLNLTTNISANINKVTIVSLLTMATLFKNNV